jgi:hypothetical protein
MTAEQERIDPGMVLAVTAYVTGDDSRAVLRKEAVSIEADGPTVITSSPQWNS